LAEEVEISNVGGENGVASEATLASLTRAIEKLAASTGRDPKKEAGKVQKAHNDAVKNGITVVTKNRDALEEKTKATKKATDATNRYSKAMLGAIGGLIGSIGQSVLGLTKALFDGGDQLSDFAQHIPLIGSLITPFTQMLDNSISTFRDLSSVGAGFNNSITEMRMTAASLELNLDEMSNLVRNNSENFRLLGGTVTEGVNRFTAINRAVKATGNFSFLKNLGFTIEEVNEGIANYAALQSRMGRLQNMSVGQLAQGSTNYLVQLDRLAKVTGKSRKELEASMAAQAQDAGFRALANQLTGDSLENFRASMALIDTLPADVAAGLKDLADGLPQTEEGIMVLTAAGPEIMEAMRQVAAGADPQVILDALQAAGHNIEGFAGLEGEQRAIYIAALRQSNPVLASILDSATRLMEVGTAEYDAAIAEQARREEITGTLTTFDDAIKEMRATIASAILDSGLFEDLAGAVASVADLIKSEDFKNAFKDFIGTIKSFIDNFRNFGLDTALFGGTETIETRTGGPQTVEIDGLFADLFGEGGVISSAFTSVAPQLTTMFTDILGSAFGAIGGGITTWFDENWGKILTGALVGVGVLLAAPFVGIGALIVAPVIAAFAGIATYFGLAQIEEWISDAWNSVTGVFSDISDRFSNFSFSKIFDDLWNKVTSAFDFELPDVGSFLPDWMRSDETVEERELNANAANEFAGYGGMATGGIATGPTSGYPMQLHGTEAVVPLPNGRSIPVDFQKNMFDNMRSTPTNEIPKIEIDNIAILSENIQDMKTELVKSINTTNQSSQETIKQLNKLMSQVLEVMQEMAEDSGNIERNTRSMGSNIANGRISAVR
jgi:ElaB/YqjD/DUF883 family membrane-anchored ribosome-binding protein